MSSTRERILEASIALWNERGFAPVTVAEVAARVGISTGNLSYHFPTKRELVLAAWDQAEKRHLEWVHSWEPETVLEDLPRWLGGLTGLMWELRYLYRDTAQLVEAAPSLASRGRATLIQEGRQQLDDCLRAMRVGGHLTIGDRELPAVADGAWLVLRYWVEFLVETRGLVDLERAHVEELRGRFTTVLDPYLSEPARRKLRAPGHG
ncbi:MAG: TetR/AcrR family transcriptional regulator [Myxococcota bacterium]|nr:TetR/AcrR family transcriptional regulator [Myxococcota bacterium]